MSVTLRIEGLDQLRRKLGRGVEPAISVATLAIGKEVKTEIARGPGPSHSPVIWASEKQRRWYFRWRRKKDLPLKYTRLSDPMSQQLEHKWGVAKYGQIGAKVFTGVRYAPWVQSKERQTAQHKATGWRTDEQAIKRVVDSGAVQRILKQAVRRHLGTE